MADRQVDRGLREWRRRLTASPDVAVIGGGIVGCAAAAFLAEAGARVELFESGELAGAASGRNSGVLQHPFDPLLTVLHTETMQHVRELDGLALADEPAGVLLLARDRPPLEQAAAEIADDAPVLDPQLLDESELAALEPALGRGLWGCRLHTGYPVRPAAVTLAFAERARRAGARLRESEIAWPWVMGGRARGVLSDGVRRPADHVLVAAGPWTPEVVDTTGSWRPIAPVWGVVVEVALAEPPRHVLEDAGVEAVAGGIGPDDARGVVFSAVTAGEVTSVGSTFLAEEPAPGAWIGPLLTAAVRFLPTLAGAPVRGTRACARPQSFDGRPLVGQLGGTDGLWVAAGHGPWGMSAGAATARIAADALLGRGEIPAELAVSRFRAGAGSFSLSERRPQ